MIRTLVIAVTLALLALPAVAQDAPASGPVVANAAMVNGPVQVNQGEQFLPLSNGQALRAGDRVMALRKGSAMIHFADGCDLRVEPETMVVVPEISTCSGGVVDAQSTAPAGTGAVGSGAASGGFDWAGFMVVAGTVAVGDAILFNQDDNEGDNETISP